METPTANTKLCDKGPTYGKVFVDVLRTIHYLLVAHIPSDLRNNTSLFGARSRPGDHVKSMKINIVAEIIKVKVFGVGQGGATLKWSIKSSPNAVQLVCAVMLCQFIEDRLQSSAHGAELRRDKLLESDWSNTVKVIQRRMKHGIWSVNYLRRIVDGHHLRSRDNITTKALFMPIAISCEKLCSDFGNWFGKALSSNKLFMRRSEYNSTNADGLPSQWTVLVGDVLYPTDE